MRAFFKQVKGCIPYSGLTVLVYALMIKGGHDTGLEVLGKEISSMLRCGQGHRGKDLKQEIGRSSKARARRPWIDPASRLNHKLRLSQQSKQEPQKWPDRKVSWLRA